MRKVLSFVLVLTLVLSSFSMAFAATPAASAAGLTDIAGNANAEAIQVVYDLGIVTGNPDGTFLPDKTVNRAEFAAMLTRALNVPDSALAGYTATTFKDTAGYGWAVPYLAFCQSKGILLGDGAGNVMPGKTISMNEAITMALRAIGYTANSSELVGAWPSNYVTIAQNVNLYDDVAKALDVTKAMAAQIIYNDLTVQKVVVNADGDTNWLWADADDEELANLLNTNLDCDATEDYIITGDDYDATLINISNYIGAYGTVYTNSDEDIVAFIADSTALTGKVDGDKFKVGDTKYTFDDNGYASPVAISNTDATLDTIDNIDDVDTLASTATFDDDGEVTLNVDLSGKTIKKVYSAVGWVATTDAKADASDIEAITEDHEMLTYAFVEDDNEDIDATQFSLVGVASLDKIAKDNVVYVYANGDDVRKVAVGTEVVTGNVSETDDDTVTVDGKDYKGAKLAGAAKDLPTLDQDVEMYLDAFGKVYSFDATGGEVNTYAVVKDYDPAGFDNPRVKLYTSEDATKTYTFADTAGGDDMTWVGASSTSALDAGALIGYALDNDGYVDTFDTTATAGALITVQSNKVLITTGGDLSIDSNVVVFTVDGDGGYDVAKIADVDKGVAIATGSYITNEDGDVTALLLGASFVEGSNDDVYGVFNTVKDVTNADKDPVQKATGFIDGTAFSKLTEDDSLALDSDTFAYKLYTVTVNADGTIKDAVALTDPCDVGDASGFITSGSAVSGTNSDRTVLTVTEGAASVKYTIADDAVVYKATLNGDDEFDAYEVSKTSSIREGYYVWLFDTEGDDADGIADVVIYTTKEPAEL